MWETYILLTLPFPVFQEQCLVQRFCKLLEKVTFYRAGPRDFENGGHPMSATTMVGRQYERVKNILSRRSIETSPLISNVNQCTGFYVIGTSIMKMFIFTNYGCFSP